ncbi:uncharacterized protein IL334_007940 [Kwoniella shivajii]|uniref:Amino acid transporter transmembrane domain-containing protein n=1 Tax=Kwoniella shivajii TaxID=564305 RepID=A0ABZ1DD63_9TREE|nr:hypothetical protein IL334_007940 [Kwoniella shivajii]
MSLPSGSVPIPSVPVPAPQEESQSKRSRMMQSSLELVFSYSRHQQLRYGGSAPSFIESSSSKSPSTDQRGSGQSGEEEEIEERDVSGRWADIESAAGRGRRQSGISPIGRDEDPEIIFEEEEEEIQPASHHYRTASDEPSFFHSDPLPASRANDTSPMPSSQASPVIPPSIGGKGLISINMFSPRVTSSNLSTSYGTRSSGSQTPLPGRIPRDFNASGISRAEDVDTDERTGLVKGTDTGYGALSDRDEEGNVRVRQKHKYPQGQSTDGQTLFNATAVLVGIGLLSMPLAFAYAGWVGGTVMLLGFGWLTCYTAKLLAHLIRSDPSLMGYTDIGVRALGPWAGGGIHVLFCMELFALGVALIVLFGDTLNALYPNISSNTWKEIGFIFILPTALMPLRLLSLPSLLSSVSSLLLILVLLIDGLIRPIAPGSLRNPMPTSLWPEWGGSNWLGGIGLVLAGFGGHAVMPSLARDMKRPESFDRVVNKAFTIATAISFIAGAAGYLMIGQTVSDEITRDLMQDKYHYPHLLNLFALWMIVINPLTKFGLSSRPLNITLESILGISPTTGIHIEDESTFHTSEADESDPLGSGTKSDRGERRLSSMSIARSRARRESRGMGESDWSYRSFPRRPSEIAPIKTSSPSEERRNTVLRVMSRTVVTALCVVTAVLLPGFGRVMAFLGSFSAFLICIILPLLFYIRLAPRLDPSTESTPSARWHRTAHWIMVGVCTVFMIAGTVWAFLPGSGHGELDP